jgi:cell division protein FtsB
VTTSTAAPREGRPVRSVTVAAVLFLLLLLGVAGARSWRDLDAARDRRASLELEVAEAETRIDALERRIQRLRRDPLLLERLAREELGLVKEGEVVFVLPRANVPFEP